MTRPKRCATATVVNAPGPDLFALVDAFEHRHPGAAALATLLSPAVVIEPRLLRRVRLSAAPEISTISQRDFEDI